MSQPEATHHLVRVRVRTWVFRRLQEIAKVESKRTGEHLSASDLIRGSLTDCVNLYDTTSKLFPLESEKQVKPA